MVTSKLELAAGVYSMLEALTIFRDHAGLISAIGPLRAAEFNALVHQTRTALPGVTTAHSVDMLMEDDSVVRLIGRLTILKSIVDRATARQWLGHLD
jgi:hypothetical protein